MEENREEIGISVALKDEIKTLPKQSDVEQLDGKASAEEKIPTETVQEHSPDIIIFQQMENMLNGDDMDDVCLTKKEILIPNVPPIDNLEDVKCCNGTLISGDDDDNKLKVESYSFDDTSESSQQDDQDKIPMGDGSLVNEIDSKYLEEQANLKRLLSEVQSKCTQLEINVHEKDEVISLLEKEKILLEKEKVMIKREVEMSRREKETAVMRYATVEKGVLDAKTAKDNAERKVKDMLKEMELLNIKIKQITNEKNRVCVLLDTKCHELKNNQKETDKFKNEITNLEMKIKWNSVKLKQEIDSKLNSEKKIDELTQEINQLKLNEIVKAREEIETEKAAINEKQLMEQQAALILMKHDNEEKERRVEILEKRLTNMMNDFKNSQSENATLLADCNALKAEAELQANEINDLQLLTDKQVMKIAELQSKLNDLETLRTQLAIEKEDNQRNKIELENMRLNYNEQDQEMIKLRLKETELLQFNKDLSETTVRLQNECSLLNSKAIAISLENEGIKKDKKYYDDIITNLENELTNEKEQKQEERIITAKHITEKTKLYEVTQKKLDFALGDLEAIKKKHSQATKEMSRELNQLRKKVEQIESNTNKIEPKKSAEIEIVQKAEISSSQASDSDSQSTHNEFPNIQIQEPSKKTLIDRILRLQHAGARQSEKIDFLENHSANLVSELQKKSKLLHHYMLRDQAGALASSKSDRNKAELAKYGGIMAAVYNGAIKNNTSEMTLDLSLEINRKLQAVLEDTLLKNITLKENLDTLGLEVDKLTRQLSSNVK